METTRPNLTSPSNISPLKDDLIEQAVIATLMVHGERFDEIKKELTMESFSNLRYQQIFSAMTQLNGRGLEIDMAAVYDEGHLPMDLLLDILGNLPDILWLDSTLSGHKLHSHIQLLNNLKVKRMLYNKIALGESIDDLSTHIDELHKSGLDKYLNPKELAMELSKAFEDRKSGQAGINYPIQSLTKATGGIQNGQLVIVAARPSVGKSTFLSNIALEAGLSGKKVLFASAEMSSQMVAMRLLSQMNKENYFYNDCPLTPEQVILALESANISVHQFTSVSELETKLKEHDSEIDLILVDYLQVLEPKAKYRSPYEKITHITNELVALKNKFNKPLVVASQYNRNADRQQPTMGDLRESGAIEQAADVVISLWRSNDDFENKDKKAIRIDLLKNRNGYVFINNKDNSYSLWLSKQYFEFYEEEKPQWQ